MRRGAGPPDDHDIHGWTHTVREGDLAIGWAPATSAGWAFGGAILAHALDAARCFAPDDQHPHRLTAEFLRAADVALPVEYSASALSRTRRFTTVRVDASQRERVTSAVAVGFHAAESSPEHDAREAWTWSAPNADTEPAVGGSLPVAGSGVRSVFEIRQAHRDAGIEDLGARGYWIRPQTTLGADPHSNALALAWISDFAMTHVAAGPHWKKYATWHLTSLSHAMWFHRPPRLDDWVLYEVRSPVYRNAIALAQGQFFDAAGTLIATTAQEALLRPLADAPDGLDPQS